MFLLQHQDQDIPPKDLDQDQNLDQDLDLDPKLG